MARRPTLVLVLVTAMISAIAACGPTSRHGTGDQIDAPGTIGGDGSGSSQDNCPDTAKLVYTIDINNTLSTFDPMTKQFHDLGELSCDSSGTPFSMGIDRTATAWVLYSTGELFSVNTATLACTPTSWSSAMGLMEFGMGFSTVAAGGTTDTLFIAGGTSAGDPTADLATLNTQTMTAAHVGTLQGNPELTGTGSAELWGFFPDATAPRIAKLDKVNGSALTTLQLPSLAGMPADWAFAFWGGDFWVFLLKDFEFNTTVYQVDGTTGAVKGNTDAVGRTIVGAGVSTCAPVIL